MPGRIQRRRERRSCNSLRVTFRALIVRVLVASPSDVLTGRDTVESAINRWNIDNASDAGVVLLPVRWETSATAEIGGAPQDVIKPSTRRDVGHLDRHLRHSTGLADSHQPERYGRGNSTISRERPSCHRVLLERARCDR